MQTIGLFFKVLWSPGEAMFLLSKNPRVLAPMLFLTLCSVLATIAVQTKVKFGELYMNMLAVTPQLAQMPEEAKANMQRLMNSPAINGVFIGFAIVGPLLMILIVTALYFGAFTIAGREGGFKAFLSITAFAFVPIIFSYIAMIVRAFVVVPSLLMLDEIGSLSPAPFLDRGAVTPLVFAAINSIDLVTIWTLILLVIGYSFVTPKSQSKVTRALVVFGVFAVYLALKLAGPALQSL